MQNDNSEDDTFRLLKRIPFEEMRRILIEMTVKGSFNYRRGLLTEYGWTDDEFDEALSRYIKDTYGVVKFDE